MPVFIARLVSDDRMVVLEHVEVYIDDVRQGSAEEWHGCFALPLDPEPYVTLGMYHIYCTDGRRGQIMITRIMADEHFTFCFHGLRSIAHDPGMEHGGEEATGVRDKPRDQTL